MLPPLEPPRSAPDDLDDIGRAFFVALDRDGSPVFRVAACLGLLVLLAALFRWVRREVLRERAEQEALDARHRAALSEAAAHLEQREWVRVPAHLPITVKHTSGPHRHTYEHCETQNLSGRGVAFTSYRPPPPGSPLRFSLDLGEKRPLSLRGVVVRVEPPPAPGAPSLVALKLGPMTTGECEQVVRWVTHQQTREIVESRRGRLCALCHRPLADATGEVHSACATAELEEPPRSGHG